MVADTTDKDAPMPSGVEAMTKQELWNWFHRSQRASAEVGFLRDKFFTLTTGLHPANSRIIGDPHAIIEAQRKRTAGLEQQMGEMQKGYERKLRKAVAAAVAPGNEALALLREVRDSFLCVEDDNSISVSTEIDTELFNRMCALLAPKASGTDATQLPVAPSNASEKKE